MPAGTKFKTKRPMYSLFDLVQDIRAGRRTDFPYNGNTYTVERVVSGGYWIKNAAGRAAFTPVILNSMDIHGTAAFLDAHPEEQTYHFDAEGNVIAPHRFVQKLRNQ